jgi:hypothetical protein
LVLIKIKIVEEEILKKKDGDILEEKMVEILILC